MSKITTLEEGAGDMSGESVNEMLEGPHSRHFRRLCDIRHGLTKQTRSSVLNNTIKAKLGDALAELRDERQPSAPPPSKRRKKNL